MRDPKLQYVISGDLVPMSRRLKKLGFQIFATLENQTPDTIRKTWKKLLKRLQQSPKVTTFFFYYSGHADRQHFHMGPRGANPLSYNEFARFMSQVQVRRRFVLLDACFSGELLRQFGSLERYKTLMQKGLVMSKGVRKKLSFTDLRKHFPSQGEKVRGLHILSSSRYLSYESNRRRGSVFTYHFLRGLQGNADLDRDGKISFNELFLYVKPRVRSETGQSPQQWLFRVGSETYGFAPVYGSMLRINSYVQGQLQVRVEGFVWRWQKSTRQQIRLAVTSGYGHVYWKKGKKCWKQRLYFPPSRVTSLVQSRWVSVSCRPQTFLQKGDVVLPLKAGALTLAESWTFELRGGLWGTTGLLDRNGDLGGLGWVGIRGQYFALLVGVGGSQSFFPQSGDVHHLLAPCRLEVGFRQVWNRFDLFVGGYVQAGLLVQDLLSSSQEPLLSFHLQFGAVTSMAYWLFPQVALVLSLDLGATPRFSNVDTNFFFAYGVHLGVRIRWNHQSVRLDRLD
ncbi:MAG: caspase family protein [Deltaproteobacteria bacterium]|nr:MAG: caspase family protein [Deltaproteobacteria bacterium]